MKLLATILLLCAATASAQQQEQITPRAAGVANSYKSSILATAEDCANRTGAYEDMFVKLQAEIGKLNEQIKSLEAKLKPTEVKEPTK